jgi:hypothetical protein
MVCGCPSRFRAAVIGRLSPDSCRSGRSAVTAALGHIQTFEKQKAPAPGRIEGIDHDNAIASST